MSDIAELAFSELGSEFFDTENREPPIEAMTTVQDKQAFKIHSSRTAQNLGCQ